jgi:phosphate starvation-inducible protein PhoH and related proteins
MASERFEFESPRVVQALFGHDLGRLEILAERLDARVTSRDGWVEVEGEEWAVEEAEETLRRLELLMREGVEIVSPVFDLMVEAVAEGRGELMEQALAASRLLGGARRPPVVAKTRGQLEYLAAMAEHEVVFGLGPAGTGKTYLAMAKALAALRAKEVRRVVLTRPAVEAGEALGFLPGDLKEKIFPYLRPLYDALYDMLEPEEVEKYIERGMIEVAPLAYMRGRTLAHSFVILDEAQNTSQEQMFMFLTRIGLGSRAVITGDPTQNDLKRGMRSGLAEAAEALPGTPGVGFVHFSKADVVRHRVVREIIAAYERHREEGKG